METPSNNNQNSKQTTQKHSRGYKSIVKRVDAIEGKIREAERNVSGQTRSATNKIINNLHYDFDSVRKSLRNSKTITADERSDLSERYNALVGQLNALQKSAKDVPLTDEEKKRSDMRIFKKDNSSDHGLK